MKWISIFKIYLKYIYFQHFWSSHSIPGIKVPSQKKNLLYCASSSSSCPHSLSLSPSVKLLERVVYTHHPHFLTFHHSSNQCNMASVTMKLLLPRSTIIYMSVNAKDNSQSSSCLTSQQLHSWLLPPPRNSLPFTSVALHCPDFPSTYLAFLPIGSLRYCGSAGLGSMSFKLYSYSTHTPQETSSISVPSNTIFMLMTHKSMSPRSHF